MKATLTFWNGTDTATGSEFMLESGDTRLLIDCGLTQGMKHLEERNGESFAHPPHEITALLVTHAHMDHIGRIAKLVHEGFKGVIYSSEPTRALAECMLNDALKIMALKEKLYDEKPLYERKDLEHALSLWKTIEKNETFTIGPFTISTLDAGHILGSIMYKIKGDDRTILFTGDLGNTPHPILPDTEAPGDAQYIVMESVYGDRNHENKEGRSAEFKRLVKRAIDEKGTLLIPVFSLERSQDILFELNALVESKEIPPVPIFLDSPLAIDVTSVYQQYERTPFFNHDVHARIEKGDDVFSFKGLELSYTVEDSKEIDRTHGAKIIIAGSGMSHGGRIQHHEMHHLDDPKTTLLLVGYQIPGSIGRRLLDGEKEVEIFEKKVKVRARIESILSYSAHKDSDHLQEFAGSAENLEQVFIVLGEPKSRMFLAQRLHDYHGISTILPERKESFEIEL